jgi:hypothetical protein
MSAIKRSRKGRRPRSGPAVVAIPSHDQLWSFVILWTSTWSNWGISKTRPSVGEAPFAWVAAPEVRTALQEGPWKGKLEIAIAALYERAGRTREEISCSYGLADFWSTTVRRRSRLAEVREHLATAANVYRRTWRDLLSFNVPSKLTDALMEWGQSVFSLLSHLAPRESRDLESTDRDEIGMRIAPMTGRYPRSLRTQLRRFLLTCGMTRSQIATLEVAWLLPVDVQVASLNLTFAGASDYPLHPRLGASTPQEDVARVERRYRSVIDELAKVRPFPRRRASRRPGT